MAESKLRNLAIEFSNDIILLCRKMRKQGVEFELIGQLLRAATSVGANVSEAQRAQSKKDFISKLEIASKECNECEYWLTVHHNSGDISDDDYFPLRKKWINICRMLVCSVTTAKKNLQKNKM